MSCTGSNKYHKGPKGPRLDTNKEYYAHNMCKYKMLPIYLILEDKECANNEWFPLKRIHSHR